MAPLLVYAAVEVSPWLWLVGAWLAWPTCGCRCAGCGRAWGRLLFYDLFFAFIYLPVIRLIGDLAKMAGYPAGVGWRVRRK